MHHLMRPYHYWHLLVKQRVYREEKDSLMQYDKEARIVKLERMVKDLMQDYDQLLGRLEAHESCHPS